MELASINKMNDYDYFIYPTSDQGMAANVLQYIGAIVILSNCCYYAQLP